MARSSTGTLAARRQPTRPHYQPPNPLSANARSTRITPRGPARANANTPSVQLRVTGWRESRAAQNDDSGVSALTSFLERRAAYKKKSPVRIRRSRIEGDSLVVTAATEDARFILMTDNYSFAGNPIKIETVSATGNRAVPTGPRATPTFSFSRNNPVKEDDSLSPAQITEKFKNLLASRYYPDRKLLDLSDLNSHPDIQAMVGVTGDPFSRRSLFPALMKVCNQTFDSEQSKANAIESVSLANNKLHRVTPVLSLAQTFPSLKNLDLSGNKFEYMGAITQWKKEFQQLEHILLQDTLLEKNVSDFRAQLIRWYPKIRMIDTTPVTEQEATEARTVKPLPPIRGPVWQDQGGVGEQFLRAFYEGFDKDRKALVNYYYDDESKFSLAVNTSALRDPAVQEKQKSQSWSQWIPQSRNLMRISYAGARHKRMHHGREDIAKTFLGLPTTRHPALGGDDLSKWLLECHPSYRVPDPSGQHPQGVDGLMITVHGEFDEVDGFGNPSIKRSFDRTFILGPGPNGVRVANDIMTLRAYGGTQAFQATDRPASPDDNQKIVLEVMNQTGMNSQYSTLCLEQTGWVLADALAAFARERANIPAEAFTN